MKPFTFTRVPCLGSLGPALGLTGDDVDDPIGNPQRLVELLCRPDHLVKHLPGLSVVGGGVHKLLDLAGDQDKLSLNRCDVLFSHRQRP